MTRPKQEPSQIQVVDETPWVHNRSDGGDVSMRRQSWKFGGYVATATCGACMREYSAGGEAGEKKLLLWAERHPCRTPDAQYDFETAEGPRLFR